MCSNMHVEQHSNRLFVASLAISNFAIASLGVLTGLLLVDMASTFDVSVGIMGQNNTASYVVAVVFALLVGVLSVRFKHKSLMITGLLCVSISALGCSLASTFSTMVTFYSLNGVGMAMVFPMSAALVGEHLPIDKRAFAIGWIVAGGSIAYIFGAPTVGFLAGLGGWRFAILTFALPVSLLSFLLAWLGVPSESQNPRQVEKGSYLASFKEILSNRSATACLVGNLLHTAAFMAIAFYGASFFRQRFYLTTDSAAFIFLGAALCYTVGSLVSGQLVNRFTRKPVTVLTVLLAGIFTVFFVFLPNVWFSLFFSFLGALFSGMGASAASSLTLEQVPRFRGAMMSINSAASSLGNALGASVGGLALVLFDYELLGAILGLMGVLGAVIFRKLTSDLPVQSY